MPQNRFFNLSQHLSTLVKEINLGFLKKTACCTLCEVKKSSKIPSIGRPSIVPIKCGKSRPLNSLFDISLSSYCVPLWFKPSLLFFIFLETHRESNNYWQILFPDVVRDFFSIVAPRQLEECWIFRLLEQKSALLNAMRNPNWCEIHGSRVAANLSLINTTACWGIYRSQIFFDILQLQGEIT